MSSFSARRRASLLVGLIASFWIGCGHHDEGGARTRTVLHLGSLPAEAFQPSASTGNVSRPLLHPDRSLAIDLHGTRDAYVEFEMLPQDSASTRPRVVLEDPDQHLELSVEERASALQEPAAWRRMIAALPDGLRGRFSMHIDASSTDGTSIVSLPRLVQPDPRPPAYNVLWIVLDTVRADFLGCYGGPAGISPRIDELADRGVLFERAVSQAGWTLPAMVSMLTGLHAESHGVVHTEHRLPAQAVTVAERMSVAGFTTAAVVSGTFTDSYWGMDQGFDHFDDLGMVVDDHGASPRDPTDTQAMKNRAHRRITSPLVTDRAIAWLEEHPQRRFFLMTHYFDPHLDYLEHSGISERFAPMPCSSPRLCALDPDPQETARLRAFHAGEIAFTDLHIGRLLDYLDERGLLHETIVVLTADHGEEFYERKFLAHGNFLFNEVIRVPLIVVAPGGATPPGRRVRTPVASLDIGATLLELTGTGGIDFGQGRSLVPLLQQDGPLADRSVFSSLWASVAPAPGLLGKQIAYRVDRGAESLIIDPRMKRTPALLFDWREDEIQSRNLASRRPEVVQVLQDRYRIARERLQAERLAADNLELSDEIREELRALGYESD
jgi:arylsulfatase